MGDGYPDNRDRLDRERSARDDRGPIDRGRDDVRSWLGDEDAARRRRLDEHDRWRSQAPWADERNYSSDREYGDPSYGWRSPNREPGASRMTERDYSTWRGAAPSPADARVLYGRDDRPAPDYGRYTEYGPQAYSGPYGRERAGAREWASSEAWRVPGPHTGRGPRGYQRSDDRIREEINDRLTAHGLVDATDVECRVVDGEVTLTGYVDSRAAKRAAEDVADDLYGVREVHNHLRIRPRDAEGGVGRTSVLGLTDPQPQTTNSPALAAADPGRPRTRS
jgi:hypothetical protein